MSKGKKLPAGNDYHSLRALRWATWLRQTIAMLPPCFKTYQAVEKGQSLKVIVNLLMVIAI